LEVEKKLQTANPRVQVAYLVADLSLQAQVRSLAGEIGRRLDSWGKKDLDGLVNNAGTFTFRRILTADGFEMQWAVNHLAPFLLTHKLLPRLQAASQSRVITVSSVSHYRGRIHWEDIQLQRRYNGLKAYQQTKLANVLFTAELNRRVGDHSGLRAFAADPGLVQTDIGLKDNPGLVRWVWKLLRARGISPEESAQGVVSLLEQEGIQNASGIYWKHGVSKAPNRRALDEQAARRLWVLSARMCGTAEI
jgi:NAD(P)-dependent dehydrogenase (short-subunit alcohol dehydrogenase family)